MKITNKCCIIPVILIYTTLILSCCKTNNTPAHEGDFEIGSTSVEMAKNMSVGWNLGNTLDATADYTDAAGKFHWTNNAGIKTENNWGMPVTTQKMIAAIKGAGFKTIRIPVSWHNHISDGKNYTVDPAWMSRVKEVVDYAYNLKICVIINIHHDNMAISKMGDCYGFALSDDPAIQEKSQAYIGKIWTQIASTFASYDDRLVFEVLNEPRDIGGEFSSAKGWTNSSEWWTNKKAMIDIITSYEQTAINAIRAVDGNQERYIMVPGYAGSGADKSMLSLYTLPKDSASDKLILSAHAYSPYNFAMSGTADTRFDQDDKNSLDAIFSYLKANYTDKGIGVVMGEASASDKKNLSDRVAWASYYFAKARDAKIPVILWDNMVTVSTGGDIESGECHGYLDRNKLSWYFPTFIEAAMKAVYGSSYSNENLSSF